MKKTILIFTVGALGFTAVNAQQQMPKTQEQMEITHQLTDGVRLSDLPEAVREKLDEIIEDEETQIVHIEEAEEADKYEITFRKEDRMWKQKFDKEGQAEGDEREVDTRPADQFEGMQQRVQEGQQEGRQRVREGQQRVQEGQQRVQEGQQEGQQRVREGHQRGVQETHTRRQEARTQAGQAQQRQRERMEGATRIQDRDLPENIRNTIRENEEDRDAQIDSIERGMRDGQENYDITFRHNDRTWTRTYGRDGKEIRDDRRRDDN